jgi:hypothetical protein
VKKTLKFEISRGGLVSLPSSKGVSTGYVDRLHGPGDLV